MVRIICTVLYLMKTNKSNQIITGICMGIYLCAVLFLLRDYFVASMTIDKLNAILRMIDLLRAFVQQ